MNHHEECRESLKTLQTAVVGFGSTHAAIDVRLAMQSLAMDLFSVVTIDESFDGNLRQHAINLCDQALAAVTIDNEERGLMVEAKRDICNLPKAALGVDEEAIEGG